ncbi:amino acid/polyamine transporter I [Geopyxis carbonaria]|nr:amino acid/polyamine transporter I [Geopyxis carbonaria]
MADATPPPGQIELKALPNMTAGTAASSEASEPPERPRSFGLRDRSEMAEFGKKQQLRRHFGFLSMVGFTCILTSTWESMFSTFLYGFSNGGPAGLVYGYLFCWAGTLATVASIAEMASMVPLSGGQYFWVYYMAPRSCRKFLSYLTGWTNVLGWQAGTTSLAFLAGTQIQGLLVLNFPGYTFARWHGTLLLYAVILVSLGINTVLAPHLPKVEGLIFILHIVGFFCILIPLVYLSPHSPASSVFTTFLNEGDWPSPALSWLIGLITSVYSFLGTDSACHMAEEIRGASTIVPRSMLAAIVINGVLGFAMLLAVLFSLGDLDRIMTSTTGYPFIELFYQATASVRAATAMTALVIALGIFASAACFTTASRMTWAFARDRGLPYSAKLASIDPRTQLPLYSLLASTVFSLLLALINIASAAAFSAILSIVVAGLFSSYLISISLLLHRRLRPSVERTQLRWGPWRMGRWSGAAVNGGALVYVVVAMTFSFFPMVRDSGTAGANWSPVVFGAVLLWGGAYYLLVGRRRYDGPVVEIAGAVGVGVHVE